MNRDTAESAKKGVLRGVLVGIGFSILLVVGGIIEIVCNIMEVLS